MIDRLSLLPFRCCRCCRFDPRQWCRFDPRRCCRFTATVSLPLSLLLFRCCCCCCCKRTSEIRSSSSCRLMEDRFAATISLVVNPDAGISCQGADERKSLAVIVIIAAVVVVSLLLLLLLLINPPLLLPLLVIRNSEHENYEE